MLEWVSEMLRKTYRRIEWWDPLRSLSNLTLTDSWHESTVSTWWSWRTWSRWQLLVAGGRHRTLRKRSVRKILWYLKAEHTSLVTSIPWFLPIESANETSRSKEGARGELMRYLLRKVGLRGILPREELTSTRVRADLGRGDRGPAIVAMVAATMRFCVDREV